MEIQVDTDRTIEAHEAWIAEIEVTVGEILVRFVDHLTRVEVHLSDASAGRSGPDVIHCTVEARPIGRAPVVATDDAATPDGALRGALHKMKRLLDGSPVAAGARRTRDSIRDHTS